MYLNPTATFELITPGMAEQLLVANTRNRPLRPNHVQFLATEIRYDRLMPNFAIQIAHTSDNQPILINGQHTLNAIILADKPVALPIVRTFNCSEDDLKILYATTDIQKKRSFADTAVAYHISEQMHVPKRTVDEIAAALRFIYDCFGCQTPYNLLPVGVLLEQVPLWAPEYHRLDAAISPIDKHWRRLLYKSAVFSVALITFHYAPDLARDFWRQVAQDDAIPRGDPRKALHDLLPRTIRIHKNLNRPVESNLLARLVIHAWNAYVSNQQLHRLMISKESYTATVRIKKTAFSGNQARNFLPLRNPADQPYIHVEPITVPEPPPPPNRNNFRPLNAQPDI